MTKNQSCCAHSLVSIIPCGFRLPNAISLLGARKLNIREMNSVGSWEMKLKLVRDSVIPDLE